MGGRAVVAFASTCTDFSTTTRALTTGMPISKWACWRKKWGAHGRWHQLPMATLPLCGRIATWHSGALTCRGNMCPECGPPPPIPGTTKLMASHGCVPLCQCVLCHLSATRRGMPPRGAWRVGCRITVRSCTMPLQTPAHIANPRSTSLYLHVNQTSALMWVHKNSVRE